MKTANAALLSYGYTFYETAKLKCRGETIAEAARLQVRSEKLAAVGIPQDICGHRGARRSGEPQDHRAA